MVHDVRALLSRVFQAFTVRSSHERVITQLLERLTESQERERYWRTRCESLLDSALARTGTTGPVMTGVALKRERAADALLAGMAVQEMPPEHTAPTH